MRIALVFALVIAAAAHAQPLKVTATTGMIADTARAVGGVHVGVTALMGPGVDPHLYKATQGDLRRLMEADVVFYNGLHLEGRMEEVMQNLAKRVPVVCVTDAIPRDRLLAPEDYAGQYDPHVWFDLGLWRFVVERIRDAFIEHDAPNAEAYRAQAAAYAAKLDALDAHTRAAVASVPESRRVLVTAHDAFGYFGRAYGIEVLGLQGISTAAEFGLRDVEQLVDLIVARNLPAVFIESSISPRSVEALIAGARARGHNVRLGGELHSDALGDANGPAGTYLGMFRANVDTIVEALR